MWKPAGIRQSKESRSQQKSKDRKYWRLKGTGNLLESKLFFLLCPMQFYSRLNSLDLREGRREVRIHSRLSPTWAPMSRSQELRKDTERKHSRSPGWLRLVGSGCTDQHGSPRQGERKTKTAGSQLPAAESKLPSGRFNELHNRFLSRRQWQQEYTLNVLEVELPEFPNLTLLFASRWLWGSYLTVVCHTHEIHKTDYCDGLNKQSD